MSLQQIGRYEIKSEIGRGGMATVYLAFDPRFKREVAVKVLPSEFLHNVQFRTRFEREAHAIASLEHPAIVPVYDYGEEQNQPFLVMRYMPGGSLAEKIEGGPIPLGEATRIIQVLAEGLDEAHANKIIHRDLKPANILFDKHRNPYLSDFGIAKLVEETGTLTGAALIGTPAYMSPEQAKGDQEIDHRSDIYSLGAILFQMLSGKQPFEAKTPISLALKHINATIPSVAELNLELPARMDRVIIKAMAKDRTERFQTAGDLAAAMELVLEEEGTLIVPEWDRRTPGVIEPDLPADKEKTIIERTLRSKAAEALQKAWLGMPIWGWTITGLIVVIVAVALFSQSPPQDLSVAVEQTLTVASLNRDLPTEVQTSSVRSTSTREVTSSEFTQPTLTSAPISRATSTDGLGSTRISEKDDMVLSFVPAGPFLMGSAGNDTYAFPDEKPQREVTLSAFWIDQTEVTVAQYQLCVTARVCKAPTSCTSGSPNYGDPSMRNHPVRCISWYGARDYCEWAGRRLPTEAEWEKAARGVDGWLYPWGNAEPSCNMANYGGCVGRTTSVGLYQSGASPFGALDMSGNVQEWVADWYDPDYYVVSDVMDPEGPAAGESRVLRGGSWVFEPFLIRSANRNWTEPEESKTSYGFRCAMDASP
jgi:serine/threonine protein kinase